MRYPLPPETGYLPDLAALEALITPRAKAIVINNPSNPTGAVFPEETVRGLVALARKHDLWLIADEIYEDLVFEGAHVPAAPCDPERVINAIRERVGEAALCAAVAAGAGVVVAEPTLA